ncbi:ABC transporter substrate-binding protein [Variovorax sp. Root318D1]|uniref:ABC transporter substrate-binding protein n=1 Tax=Variovorax sp. Root318D1 TaxID=1736513 RepID=UPI0006F82F4A|nr:ABC transporter substrate-binding protein [Variovorax sp. Root318D1]KQU91760.1 ABC transporter substrate-binding protein [Variovorax sp. Root318D1]
MTPHARNRRLVLQGTAAAASAAALGLPGLAFGQEKSIKLGFVSPLTGPYALFGETDQYMVGKARTLLASGITTGGKTYPVEILVRDSQSNPNKAAELAGNLILKDKVQLMLPSCTSETINPVADQCELNGVPCLSTVQPWQSYFFSRGGKPDKPFEWTYHFFWGLEDIIAGFVGMWGSVTTNKKIGFLFERSTDGEAWASKEFGFPPAVTKAGYTFVTPPFFQPLTADFSPQIAEFKKAGVDIIAGITLPQDLKTFMAQCRQQGFKPKIVTVGKALLFPSAVEAMGDLGEGMSSEVWWTPTFPFKSSLTGETSAKIAADYEAASKKQWTQPLGYSHALWEVAIDVLKRSGKPHDPKAVRDAIRATDLTTVVGPVNWKGGPVANVGKTPVLGGQWVKGQKFKYELAIVDNSTAKIVPAAAKLKPL